MMPGHCVSFNFLFQNVAKDLVKLVHSIGFETPTSKTSKETIPTKDLSVIKAVLTAGLYPHVGRTTFTEKVDAMANPEKQACLVETTQGTCKMHPSSVNRFMEANGYVVYHEKVRLTGLAWFILTFHVLISFSINTNRAVLGECFIHCVREAVAHIELESGSKLSTRKEFVKALWRNHSK